MSGNEVERKPMGQWLKSGQIGRMTWELIDDSREDWKKVAQIVWTDLKRAHWKLVAEEWYGNRNQEQEVYAWPPSWPWKVRMEEVPQNGKVCRCGDLKEQQDFLWYEEVDEMLVQKVENRGQIGDNRSEAKKRNSRIDWGRGELGSIRCDKNRGRGPRTDSIDYHTHIRK